MQVPNKKINQKKQSKNYKQEYILMRKFWKIVTWESKSD